VGEIEFLNMQNEHLILTRRIYLNMKCQFYAGDDVTDPRLLQI